MLLKFWGSLHIHSVDQGPIMFQLASAGQEEIYRAIRDEYEFLKLKAKTEL